MSNGFEIEYSGSEVGLRVSKTPQDAVFAVVYVENRRKAASGGLRKGSDDTVGNEIA